MNFDFFITKPFIILLASLSADNGVLGYPILVDRTDDCDYNYSNEGLLEWRVGILYLIYKADFLIWVRYSM